MSWILEKTIYKILDRTILTIFLTVLSPSQNVLEMLEKHKKEPCMSHGHEYGSIHIVPNSIFAKNAWNRNKRWPFDEKLWRILEGTVWVGLYYLLKIVESFVKGQYGSKRIVFYDFFAVVQFRKLVIARFKGQYGSSADDTVHSVLVDNLVHKDKFGWNNEAILAR